MTVEMKEMKEVEMKGKEEVGGRDERERESGTEVKEKEYIRARESEAREGGEGNKIKNNGEDE
jgi:hypothetical protein